MSTYLYLVCLDHTPPLVSDGESGQFLCDLPQIRADIADREHITAMPTEDVWCIPSHLERNTAQFLRDHPTCQIGIRDEYGRHHETTTEQG